MLTDEAGKVASTAIDALKHQPALLAVILLNALFAGAVSYLFLQSETRQHTEFVTVIDRCFGQATGRAMP